MAALPLRELGWRYFKGGIRSDIGHHDATGADPRPVAYLHRPKHDRTVLENNVVTEQWTPRTSPYICV